VTRPRRAAAFVCVTCREPVTIPSDRMEKRIEYRRVSDQGRYKVRIIATMCRACVDAEADQDGGPTVETKGLF